MAEQPQEAGLAERPGDASPPPLEEALAWKGRKLDELGGSSVGRVEGVLVDAEGGEPVWLLLRLGRFGHFTALPYAHAVAGAGRIWAPYARDFLRAAPRLKAGAPLTREQELELCARYGLGGAEGRGAEVEKRAAEAITSKLGEAPGS